MPRDPQPGPMPSTDLDGGFAPVPTRDLVQMYVASAPKVTAQKSPQANPNSERRPADPTFGESGLGGECVARILPRRCTAERGECALDCIDGAPVTPADPIGAQHDQVLG